MENKNILRILLAFCMILWASIGILTRVINLDSFELAFFRAFLALPVLIIFLQFSKSSNKTLPLKYIVYYLFTGALIGLAWVFLFQGYKYTTLTNAVLLYNMCPVYVMILSKFLLKEKITLSKTISILGCFLGLYLLIQHDLNLKGALNQGLLWALSSGIIYAIIVILNKKANQNNNNTDTIFITFLQLLGASLALLPYQIKNDSFIKLLQLDFLNIILLLILAIIHTAIAYIIYFSTYKKLEAIEIVSFSYLEPLFTILFGILIFQEKIILTQALGGIFILGFTLFGEIYNIKKKS